MSKGLEAYDYVSMLSYLALRQEEVDMLNTIVQYFSREMVDSAFFLYEIRQKGDRRK